MSYFLKGYEKQYKKSPKEAALSWFQDVRFGLFVHWGDKFNTQDYVNLALDANMKYITFVIKHHDGFAL